MVYRMLSVGLVLIAGVAFAADEKDKVAGDKGKTHSGIVVKVNAAKGTLTMRSGDKGEHEHMVAKDADITCNGKTCTLSDLKPGTLITVTMKEGEKNTVSKIAGRTKKPEGAGDKPPTP
jgi:hypothetical protein